MKKNFVLVVLALLLFSSAYADRTVWYVHPDSSLSTIQAGLDSCADNDIVLVGPGTYVENIIWPNTQAIHLISELGPEQTIIDGNNAEAVITCTTGADTATLIRGFTIRNGYSQGYGAGIHCSGVSPVICDNIITNNVCWQTGGAIFLAGGSPIIVRNQITENADPAVGIWGGSHNAIIDTNYIDHNGYGIYGEAVSIRNNTIVYNIYGVWFHGCQSQHFNNNIINYNIAHGIVTTSVPKTNYYEHRDYGNYEHRDYGNNVISYNGEYGIWADFWYWAPIRNEIITFNGAGGIIIFDAYPTYVESCIIAHNLGPGVTWPGTVTQGSAIRNCNIFDNVGYGVWNTDSNAVIDAENNWWGDATGPYHPDSNPGGLGDTVSDYVDFDPWLYDPWGVEEEPIVKPLEDHNAIGATIFSGPLLLPKGKKCKVFDITGRVVEPSKIQTGIYFIEIGGVVTQKVVKVR